MQQWLGLAVGLALALATVPALAGEGLRAFTAAGDTFQALSTLPAGEQAALTQLPDEQLAVIEGGQDVCIGCLNLAIAANLLSPGATAQTGAQSIAATGDESAAPAPRQGIAVILSVLSPGATQHIGAQTINY